MITGQDIVCVSTSAWNTPYGSRQELMSRLAGANRVLFVEYQADWLHPLRYRRLRSSGGWHPGRLRTVSSGLWVYTPPLGLPGGLQSRGINALNQRQLAGALSGLLRTLGFGRPILWIYAPQSVWLLGRLGEQVSLYHCIEAFEQESSSGSARRCLRAYEEALARRCDVVLACSQTLCARLRRWRQDVVWLPPGIDTEVFDPSRRGTEPMELRDAPRPLLGYAGAIDHRLDVPLLERLAAAFPHGTLVLVGPVHERLSLERLQRLPNVRLIGPMPKPRLPAFLGRFDVGLIPYVKTPFTDAILPLKLFEYLAMRVPVVATDLAELAPYDKTVRLASGADAFIAGVREALAGTRGLGAGEGRLVSWDARVEDVSALLAQRLDGTPGEPTGVQAAVGQGSGHACGFC
jgi:glycosyltransferase involved in cell wall biosynthesis